MDGKLIKLLLQRTQVGLIYFKPQPAQTQILLIHRWQLKKEILERLWKDYQNWRQQASHADVVRPMETEAEASAETCKNGRLRHVRESAWLLLERSRQERRFHPLTRDVANGSIKFHGWGTKGSKCQRRVSCWWKWTWTFCCRAWRNHPSPRSALVPDTGQMPNASWIPHACSQPTKPCPRGALVSTGFVQKRFLPFFPFKDKL